MSPGMGFLGLVPGWRNLSSSHTGHEEQERALSSALLPSWVLQLLDEGCSEHQLCCNQLVTCVGTNLGFPWSCSDPVPEPWGHRLSLQGSEEAEPSVWPLWGFSVLWD